MGKQGKSDAVTTFIGADAVIEGSINFDGTIRIDGRAKGRISSKSGTLIVGEKAVIEAEISVDVAIIMGEVNGTVSAGNRIEAFPPCRINGDIQAPTVSIEPGVMFNGTCAMTSKNVTPLRRQDTVEAAASTRE